MNRLGDVLERPLTETLEHEVGADPLGGGGAHDDLAALGRAGEPRRHVGGRPGGGERPALPRAGAELGGADQRLAGVDAHVELDRREDPAVFLVQRRRPLVDGEGCPRRVQRVVGRAALRLEDDHQAVAGRLVHVAVVALDDLQKAREIGLHELIEALGVELLGELRVAGDVEEHDRDLDRALLELGRVRAPLEELLDGVGHELGQLALELLEQRQSLARLLEVLERGLQLLVLGRQLGVGPGEPRRHVVERAPELADLVARLGWRPRLEIAVADAPGDRRECHDRADDDGAHRHRQDGRGGQDGQHGDEDLAVPVAADLAEDRLHRGRDPHHRAHLVIAAVAALTLLLVEDRIVLREERDAVLDLQRLLGGQGLQGPGEERARHRRAGRPLHLRDVLHDVVREPGGTGDFGDGREVGERLDAVAAIDHQRFERGRVGDRVGPQLAELLDEAAGDVGPLLQHRGFDAGHDRLGEPSDRLLVLLDQCRRLALDRHDRRDAEPDDQDRHDQQGDLERQPGPEHHARAGIIGPV